MSSYLLISGVICTDESTSRRRARQRLAWVGIVCLVLALAAGIARYRGVSLLNAASASTSQNTP
jgi:hypothetical protein